jgi:peptidyl-tRNA hydrolase, PTH1 family
VSERFLIVGLGNPGREYRNNRHNVGFVLLDRLAARNQLMAFTKRQGQALITTGTIQAAPVILAKPQTYMNLSGQAVGALVRFYNLPLERMLVCLDDIDLPLGKLRLRAEGGSAGQGGLKSVIQHVGTEVFPRLRIGVGRPPGSRAAASYVLKDFRTEEYDILNAALDNAANAGECYIAEGIVAAMNRYNGSVDTP